MVRLVTVAQQKHILRLSNLVVLIKLHEALAVTTSVIDHPVDSKKLHVRAHIKTTHVQTQLNFIQKYSFIVTNN